MGVYKDSQKFGYFLIKVSIVIMLLFSITFFISSLVLLIRKVDVEKMTGKVVSLADPNGCSKRLNYKTDCVVTVKIDGKEIEVDNNDPSTAEKTPVINKDINVYKVGDDYYLYDVNASNKRNGIISMIVAVVLLFLTYLNYYLAKKYPIYRTGAAFRFFT